MGQIGKCKQDEPLNACTDGGNTRDAQNSCKEENQSEHKKPGCVRFGDQIYIKNLNARSSYLDTCKDTDTGGYGVPTHRNPTRHGLSGTWGIEGGEKGACVPLDDAIYIRSA